MVGISTARLLTETAETPLLIGFEFQNPVIKYKSGDNESQA